MAHLIEASIFHTWYPSQTLFLLSFLCPVAPCQILCCPRSRKEDQRSKQRIHHEAVPGSVVLNTSGPPPCSESTNLSIPDRAAIKQQSLRREQAELSSGSVQVGSSDLQFVFIQCMLELLRKAIAELMSSHCTKEEPHLLS